MRCQQQLSADAMEAAANEAGRSAATAAAEEELDRLHQVRPAARTADHCCQSCRQVNWAAGSYGSAVDLGLHSWQDKAGSWFEGCEWHVQLGSDADKQHMLSMHI